MLPLDLFGTRFGLKASLLVLLAATPATAQSLLVTQFVSGAVARFDAATGLLQSTLASVSSPAGLVVAPNGNLLVATGGNSVVEVNLLCGQVVGTFASGGGLAAPRDLLFGPNGNLFVASRSSNAVLEYDGVTGAFVRTFATTGLQAPIGLAFAPATGNLFVASLNNDTVIEFDGVTGAQVQVTTVAGPLDGPVALLFRPNGNLLVSSSITDQVLEYDPVTGAFLGVFASGSGLDNPIGLAFDVGGDLLVCSSNSSQVLQYNGVTGAFVGVRITGSAAWDLVVEPVGGGLPSVPGYGVTTYATMPGPFMLSFAPNGDLFVGQQTVPAIGVLAHIFRVAPNGVVSTYGSLPTLDPDAVVYDAQGMVSGIPGSVLVAGICGTGVSCVHRIAPDQTVTQLVGPGGPMSNPYEMAFDSQGRLLITDNNSSSLYQLGAGGALSTFVGLTSPATGVALDGNGQVYLSYANGTVALHSASGALLNASVVSGLGVAPPIACGPGGSLFGTDLYALDPSAGQLLRIDAAGVVTVIGTGFANDQSDIAFGPDGALYVSQVCSGRVLRIGDGASNQSYGAGCPASAPMAHTATLPVLGQNLVLSTTNVPAGTVLGLTVLGLQPVSLNLGLVFGPLSGGCYLLASPDVVLATVLPGSVFGDSLPLPLNPSLVGANLQSQGAAVVSFAPIVIATSNANLATLGW